MTRNPDGYNYTVYPELPKGVGCIDVQGHQSGWLTATRAVLGVELGLEAIDAVVLIFVSAERKLGHVKIRRPWCTMVIGIVVWATMIGIGYAGTQSLPVEGTSVALGGMISESNSFCLVGITPAGLRGALIGWGDGLFINSRLYWGGLIAQDQ